MMQKEKINSYQFLVLVIFFSIGTSILNIPSVLAADSKQDAWISAIIGTGIGLLVIWLLTTIGLWFPQLTYVQINEKILGKWLGKVVSLLFVLMSFLFTSNLLVQSGVFLTTNMMPNTPMVALNILMAFILVMGVRLGLETIARTAEVLIVVFFSLLFILVASISPTIQVENIQPILEVGTKTIIQSSFYVFVTSSVNAVVLLMIFPACIDKIKYARKSFLIGNLIGGIVVIIITFLCISVLNAEETARQIYPSYILAKRISFGDFIERIEALMAALWIMAIYFKMVLYFYVSVIGMAQILNLKDYRPLTYPLVMIAVALSLVILPDIVYQKEWERTTSVSFSLSIGLLIPLILVAIYTIRKKQLKKDPDSS